MDVATVEVRGASFPYLRLRMQRLNGFPNCLSDTLALNTNLHIEKRQFTIVLGGIDGNDGAAHTLAVSIDSLVGFCTFSL